MEEIGFNMAVSKFRGEIIEEVNKCGLPISVVLFILKDVVRETEKKAEILLKEEIKEYNIRKEKQNGQGTTSNDSMGK